MAEPDAARMHIVAMPGKVKNFGFMGLLDVGNEFGDFASFVFISQLGCALARRRGDGRRRFGNISKFDDSIEIHGRGRFVD